MEQTFGSGVSEEIYAALQKIVAEKRPAPLVPTLPELSTHWSNLRPLEARLNEISANPSIDLSAVPIKGRVRLFKRLVLKSTYWLFHPLFQRISHFQVLFAQFARFSLDELRQLSVDIDSVNKHLQRWETLRTRMDVALREVERVKLAQPAEWQATIERLSQKVSELEGRLATRETGSPHLTTLRAAQAEAGGEIIEIATRHAELTDALKRAGALARAIEPAALVAVADETVGALAVVCDVAAMRGDQVWLLVQTALRKIRPNGLILFETTVSDGGGIRPAALGTLLEASGFRDVLVAPIRNDGRLVVRGKR